MSVKRYDNDQDGILAEHKYGKYVHYLSYLSLQAKYDKLKAQVEQEGALKLIESPDQRYIIRYMKDGKFHFSSIFTEKFAKDKLENIINFEHGTCVELFAISDCQYTTSPATVTVTSIRKV